MKFLLTYESQPNAKPPTPEHLAAIGAFSKKNIESGVVVLTGGMVRPTRGIQISCEKGKVSITDGPFAETKELIDGFALARLVPSAVIELNRAVAVSRAEGPAAGLALLDALADEPTLARYHLLPSARADLLERLGRFEEARAEFLRAASLAQNARQKERLEARANALS